MVELRDGYMRLFSAVVFGYFKFSTFIEEYMTSYLSVFTARLSILSPDHCRGLDIVIGMFYLKRHQIHKTEVVFLLILNVRKFRVKYMANFNNSFIPSFNRFKIMSRCLCSLPSST